jgi:hypothetical protein
VAAALVDTHAAAISVATLVASGKVTPQDAVLPILAAQTWNSRCDGPCEFRSGTVCSCVGSVQFGDVRKRSRVV